VLAKGVTPAPGTGFVYQDLNNNAVKDAGEPGIPNTTVTQTGTDFLGSPVSLTTMTDSTGQYTFNNLLPSNRLLLATTAGLTSVSGNGTTTVTLTGTINALNAAVNGLIFTPTHNLSGTAYLVVTLNDLANTGGVAMQTGKTIAIPVM
jgi:trimeric autotransporter adhesin